MDPQLFIPFCVFFLSFFGSLFPFSRLYSCVGSPPVISPSFRCTLHPDSFPTLPTVWLPPLASLFFSGSGTILFRGLVRYIVGELLCMYDHTHLYPTPFFFPPCTITTLSFSVENGMFFENGYIPPPPGRYRRGTDPSYRLYDMAFCSSFPPLLEIDSRRSRSFGVCNR